MKPSWVMIRCTLVFGMILSNQNFARCADIEVSASGGGGAVWGNDLRQRYVPFLGASLKTRIVKPEVRIDYERIARRITTLHTFGAGWLIQSDSNKSTRPFVLLGWTLCVQSGRVTEKLMGPSLSTGFTSAIRSGLFLRPELRWKLVAPEPTMFLQPTLTVGWQF